MNHAAEYAIRATVYLAQHREQRATAAQIADALSLPRNYLSKVLHMLAHAGLLTSTRGPHGGFQLLHAPTELTLARVTEPFESEDAGSTWWRGVSGHLSTFLNNTTVQMLLDAEEIRLGGSYVNQRRAQ
jgi:DNA-binding IscR family transcriptional regulator